MLTTHILIGGAFGSLVALFIPPYVFPAVVAGMVGGLLPDIDTFLHHRKTMHWPVIGTISVAIALPLFLSYPSPLTASLFFFLGGFSLHAWSDVLSAGDELRPWQEKDDRAAYNHLKQEWITARRLVHDGSLFDFLLSIGAAATIYLLTDGLLSSLLIALVSISLIYSTVRKKFVKHAPDHINSYSGFVKHLLTRIFRQ